MRITTWVVMALWLAALSVSPARATVDVVGGTANSALPNPWNAKGNAFRVDTNTLLNEQEFFLSYTGSKNFTFYTYKAPTEASQYTLVQSNTVTRTGSAAGSFTSSGPVNVLLEAGFYYILAISPLDDVTYYFNSGNSQTTSFGAQVHGFAAGTHPLGATITTSAGDSAIYYQRITTNIPEPAAAAIGALLLLALGRRGQRI